MIRVLIVAVVLAVGLSGCAAIRSAEEAVADVEQRSTETAIFSLDEAGALRVIAEAMAEGWPDKSPERLAEGSLGYEFTLRFALDRERIIAEALPRGDGYAFRVTNRGTAPVVGVPARDKLIPLIEKYAAAASPGS